MGRVYKPVNKFTQISNTALEDPNLTWRAKGIYSYMLSRKDGWKFASKRIAQCARAEKKRKGATEYEQSSRDIVLDTVNELIENKYMCRQKLKSGDYDYYLFNSPAEYDAFMLENAKLANSLPGSISPGDSLDKPSVPIATKANSHGGQSPTYNNTKKSINNTAEEVERTGENFALRVYKSIDPNSPFAKGLAKKYGFSE